MRTKTLLVTAALAAAGVATSMAQSNVYSLNVVGYVNVTVPTGFSIVSNPLNLAAGNQCSKVFGTNVPDGTTVFRFANGAYQNPSIYSVDDGGWLNDSVINPGEGFFLQMPSAATITFTGEVLQGSLTNPIPSGFSIRGSQVPQAGALSAALGYTPVDGDTVYTFNGATQTYNQVQVYSLDDNGWIPSEPNISVAQGFFLNSQGAKNWTRTFTVN